MENKTPKNKGGRPKGSINQAGLSLEKRLKILSKIAMDKNGKPTDIINACKEITVLLNDKVKETQDGIAVTQIKFEETIPIKSIEKPVETPKLPEINTVETSSQNNINTLTDIIQPIDNKELTEDTISFDFQIEPSEQDDIDLNKLIEGSNPRFKGKNE